MPAARLPNVTDDVLPVVVTLPGLRINVHEPAGRPLNPTEPVAVEQDGWVMVPIAGAAGKAGAAAITTLFETVDVQPKELVMVNV